MEYRFGTLSIVAASLIALLLGAAGMAFAITNGQPDGNSHPYVGLVVFDYNGMPAWRTTGILISPTIVVTAGHGTDEADGSVRVQVSMSSEAQQIADSLGAELPLQPLDETTSGVQLVRL